MSESYYLPKIFETGLVAKSIYDAAVEHDPLYPARVSETFEKVSTEGFTPETIEKSAATFGEGARIVSTNREAILEKVESNFQGFQSSLDSIDDILPVGREILEIGKEISDFVLDIPLLGSLADWFLGGLITKVSNWCNQFLVSLAKYEKIKDRFLEPVRREVKKDSLLRMTGSVIDSASNLENIDQRVKKGVEIYKGVSSKVDNIKRKGSGILEWFSSFWE